jgi:5-methylcytosine-specific restriction endonuclease McrA
VANTSVRELHYVLIYVLYNEILFPMYLCKQHLCLNCKRLCMAELDDCNILQLRHLVRKRLGGAQDSINVQNLISHGFACMSSQDMSHVTKEHLA